MEIQINIEAKGLTEALNNLASAISGKTPQPTVPTPAPTLAQHQTATVSAPAPVIPAAPPVAGVPVAAAPMYTVEQIMAAGATLMDAGKANDLVTLLHSFGVQAVMDLKPEQLGVFATKMRELGAKI